MDHVRLDEAAPGQFVLTLDDPGRLNPLTAGMVDDLHAALDEVASLRSARGLVITGAGRGFCSGANMSPDESDATGPAAGQSTVAYVLDIQERIAGLHEKIHRLRVPTIAAVNGVAVGGGFSLALACDLRYAAASARFGAVFIKVGVSGADMGTSYFLPRIVGATRAAELMMTGRIVDSAEAESYGLTLETVPDGAVVDRALQTLSLIAANSPLGVWMTKETLWHNLGATSLRQAIDVENRTQVMCFGSGDMERAREAFSTRASPSWTSL